MQQSHDAMVPGEACSHHKDAHATDEGGDVAHVGEAIPKKRHTGHDYSSQNTQLIHTSKLCTNAV